MSLVRRSRWLIGSLSLALPAATHASAAEAPSVEQALKLAPVQRDVEYDRPNQQDAAACTIKAETESGVTGWNVRDASGQMLRRFADTNGDNMVDLWCYYQNGIEVYRDVDSQKNGSKADQYRWLNTAGSRWAVDNNEDGVIDAWKQISAEEVSAEAVMALATGDAQRFARLLITKDELSKLGIGKERSTELATRLTAAAKEFSEAAKSQKTLTPATRWIHFGGSRPGVVPAGTDGSTEDISVYENVLAMIDTDGKDGQVQIGTLVRVGETWRLIDAPSLPAASGQLASTGYFFQPSAPPRGDTTTDEGGSGAPSDEMQKYLDDLQKLDEELAKATTPDEQDRLNDERSNVLEKLAGASTTAEDRAQWLRQLADTASAAVQAGSYPSGAEHLKALSEKLAADSNDAELAAYVEFRYLMADYGSAVQKENVDFPAVQAKWLESLEKFVNAHPQSPDAAEAMLQLGIAQEYAGQDEEAKNWYSRIVKDFPSAANNDKAAGAVRRLDSIGKPMVLKAKAINANGTVDLSNKGYRGNYVLVHYWATWCEPGKADLEDIQDLMAKYGGKGFAAVGVSLDGKQEELVAFLKQNKLSWPQVFEPGGLDSRLANEMGILTLPTMILVDPKGNVVNRNVQLTEVEKLLRANAK